MQTEQCISRESETHCDGHAETGKGFVAKAAKRPSRIGELKKLFGPWIDGLKICVFVANRGTVRDHEYLECRDMESELDTYLLHAEQCPPECVPGAIITMQYNRERDVFDFIKRD